MELIWTFHLATAFLGASGYLMLCRWLIQSWRKCPETTVPTDFQPSTRISIIVPARNEASCISEAINSILDQDYPEHLAEIIIVDDHSEDDTSIIVESYRSPRVRLLRLANFMEGEPHKAFKKKAIEVAVHHAAGELMVNTDADCVASKRWLRSLAYFYENSNPACILGALSFRECPGWLGRFQALEMTGMMLVTGALASRGLPWLANGANLAYPSSAFGKVGGFKGQTHLASGDDLMLVHRIGEVFPGRVAFLKNKDAVVETPVQPDWRSFVQQRIRWATKTGHYRRRGMIAALGGIFLFCIWLFAGFIWALLTQDIRLGALVLTAWGMKGLADYLLLREACTYYRRKSLLAQFWKTELFHTFYMVMAGVLGLIRRRYVWKGRKLR